MESDFVILQNYEIWKEVMELDLSTLNYKMLERKDDRIKIRGHYKTLNNNLVMFYRKHGLLYFKVNDKEINLECEDIKIQFLRKGGNNKFIIKHNEKVIYHIRYPSYRFDRLNMVDPDFNADREEDQDFFLFVYNVIKDHARRKRIYTPDFE
jgi:hypothetical protein